MALGKILYFVVLPIILCSTCIELQYWLILWTVIISSGLFKRNIINDLQLLCKLLSFTLMLQCYKCTFPNKLCRLENIFCALIDKRDIGISFARLRAILCKRLMMHVLWTWRMHHNKSNQKCRGRLLLLSVPIASPSYHFCFAKYDMDDACNYHAIMLSFAVYDTIHSISCWGPWAFTVSCATRKHAEYFDGELTWRLDHNLDINYGNRHDNNYSCLW